MTRRTSSRIAGFAFLLYIEDAGADLARSRTAGGGRGHADCVAGRDAAAVARVARERVTRMGPRGRRRSDPGALARTRALPSRCR